MPVSGRIAVLPAGRQALEVKEFTFGEPEPHQVIVRRAILDFTRD